MVESVAVATVAEPFFCPQADSINILISAVIMKICFSHANTSSEYVIAIVEYRSEHEVNFNVFPLKCKSTST